MEITTSVSEWLPWLGRVRFLIITFLVAVIVAVSQLAPAPLPVRTLVPLIALWYTFAILFVILQRWLPVARLAGVASNGLRSRGYHRRGVCNRSAGQLFYFTLLTGDPDGEHSVYSRGSLIVAGRVLRSSDA